MHTIQRSMAAVSIAALVALAGCASGGGEGASDKAAAKSTAKAAAPADKPPPAGSKLAKIALGMNDVDVRKILGEPDSSNAYMTGKAFIPFYFGPDAARTDWMYKGKGRVVFSRNRFSGGLKVIRIIYDPAEPAH